MSRTRASNENGRAHWPSRLAQLMGALCALALVISVFREPLSRIVPPSLGLAPPGFLMQVTSEPVPGVVDVNGVERGTTPYFGNVECQPDERILIRVTAEGFRPWQREVPCREGGTLQATARLER